MKGIVERHGADIRVRTDIGRGTTFVVSLPGARVPAPLDVVGAGV